MMMATRNRDTAVIFPNLCTWNQRGSRKRSRRAEIIANGAMMIHAVAIIKPWAIRMLFKLDVEATSVVGLLKLKPPMTPRKL
mmetsp:Transcript_7667/g.15534  ORF Transcript_7667/g.15534 Transcript_7667/m.15534 type:complete len:82 (-) Transcript_7667:481-726(-)